MAGRGTSAHGLMFNTLPSVTTMSTVPAERSAPASDPSGAFSPTDWALFATVSGIWGASFLLIDIGLDSLHPGVITLARVGLGALTLALLPGSRMRLEPGDRGPMLLVSITWVAIPFTLFPLAEQHINSAVTGLLNGGTPMFTALFALALFGRRTTGAQLLGLLVGLGGVALISLPSIGEGSSQASGVAMVIVATVGYGLSLNLAAPLQNRYGSLPFMARMLALGAVATLPFGLYGLPDSTAEVAPVLAVTVLGVVGTGIAYVVMGFLVERVGPTRASFMTYLIPGVSLVLGVTVRGDQVAPLALAGVALVITGAGLASRRVRTHR